MIGPYVSSIGSVAPVCHFQGSGSPVDVVSNLAALTARHKYERVAPGVGTPNLGSRSHSYRSCCCFPSRGAVHSSNVAHHPCSMQLFLALRPISQLIPAFRANCWNVDCTVSSRSGARYKGCSPRLQILTCPWQCQGSMEAPELMTNLATGIGA